MKNGTNGKSHKIAYIDGIAETVSPSWTTANYIGRSEPAYIYERGEREVNITFEAVDQGGGIDSWGACNDNIFEDDDGNTILDTVSTIIFPLPLRIVFLPTKSSFSCYLNPTLVVGSLTPSIP